MNPHKRQSQTTLQNVKNTVLYIVNDEMSASIAMVVTVDSFHTNYFISRNVPGNKQNY